MEETTTMKRIIRPALRLCLTLFVLVGLTAGTAMAQDQYVDPVNGANGNSGNDALNPVATIGQAVSNLTGGGEIAIRIDQDYAENVALSDGDYSFTSWDGENGNADLDGDGDLGRRYWSGCSWVCRA